MSLCCGSWTKVLIQTLLASAPPPAAVFAGVLVARVTDTVLNWPVIVNEVVAWIFVDPGVGDLICTVQVLPGFVTVQLDGPSKAAVAPLELVSEKSTLVPLGASTQPAPRPRFCSTCAVRTWS